jgi:hypothetical protein
LPLDFLHPATHALLENVQGHGSAEQHVVVERPNVERGPKSPLSPLPKFLDLEFSNLVGERLAGPDDVAVDLDDDVVLGFGRVLLEVIDGLFSTPTSAKLPSNSRTRMISSISPRMRSTSARPISWISFGVRSVVVWERVLYAYHFFPFGIAERPIVSRAPPRYVCSRYSSRLR